jgi:predicted nucleotide-binding protein
LTEYDGKKLPKEDIALNVLRQKFHVPHDSANRTLSLILAGARDLGLIQTINGAMFVNLHPVPADQRVSDDYDEDDAITGDSAAAVERVTRTTGVPPPSARMDNRRVFITHGKNKSFLEPLKDLLAFGELVPMVAVENESVSMPVPEKVMAAMRACSAAIIHVEAEQKLIDNEGGQHVVLNPNVLIEIGAAMALYGRRFILLVRSGVTLPSNLQGLYEVRYDGDKLDGDATIRLLKAINDIKNHPLPTAD